MTPFPRWGQDCRPFLDYFSCKLRLFPGAKISSSRHIFFLNASTKPYILLRLQEFLEKGAPERFPKAQGHSGIYSRVFAVPKPENKCRLIIDFTYLNKLIHKKSFKKAYHRVCDLHSSASRFTAQNRSQGCIPECAYSLILQVIPQNCRGLPRYDTFTV